MVLAGIVDILLLTEGIAGIIGRGPLALGKVRVPAKVRSIAGRSCPNGLMLCWGVVQRGRQRPRFSLIGRYIGNCCVRVADYRYLIGHWNAVESCIA